eukprot:6606692-Prymnesium_polylepis.1
MLRASTGVAHAKGAHDATGVARRRPSAAVARRTLIFGAHRLSKELERARDDVDRAERHAEGCAARDVGARVEVLRADREHAQVEQREHVHEVLADTVAEALLVAAGAAAARDGLVVLEPRRLGFCSGRVLPRRLGRDLVEAGEVVRLRVDGWFVGVRWEEASPCKALDLWSRVGTWNMLDAIGA